jgi:hypothetical protein
LTHGAVDGGFGSVIPLRETATPADVHGNGELTKNVAFVRFLPKGEVSVLANHTAPFAKRTNFAVVSARHAEKV